MCIIPHLHLNTAAPQAFSTTFKDVERTLLMCSFDGMQRTPSEANTLLWQLQ